MPDYRTPGVYIEEISSGPRPVQASSTTETGFVAVITIPTIFYPGRGKASGMYLPGPAEGDPQQSWNRALAFRSLLLESADAAPAKGKKGDAGAAPSAGGNTFQKLVADILPGKWEVRAPSGADNKVTMSNDQGDLLRFPVSRALMSIVTDDATKKAEWDLSFGADEGAMVQLISAYAAEQGIEHTGNLGAVDPKGKPVTLNISNIHGRLHGTAPSFTSMDGFHSWRLEFGERLYQEILMEANPKVSQSKSEVMWDTLDAGAKVSWHRWLRAHPGMRRLELSVVGFFSNGGATAFPSVALQGADGSHPVAKRAFLEKAYDGASVVAMLAAPGLNIGWQQALLEYAGPAGRGDLFAILEAPRYLLTKPPRGVKVNEFRWITEENGSNPGDYEVAELQTLEAPVASELRFGGFAADVVLDRCTPRDTSGYGACYAPWFITDNPLATGLSDKYIITPPSGFIAGVIAGTDNKAGGGVHKAPANEPVLGISELVTSVSDREQAALNVKGINIIRHRPGAGIRVWGARTVASDALWNYVNVRRLFLFVERSVRDSVNWAVFQPNNDATRGSLRDSIAGFLFRLYNQGMLDGTSWQDAFTVQCDRENNPEVDIRAGMLTVDVQIRPVFPAEFIRIRFQQTPMAIG